MSVQGAMQTIRTQPTHRERPTSGLARPKRRRDAAQQMLGSPDRRGVSRDDDAHPEERPGQLGPDGAQFLGGKLRAAEPDPLKRAGGLRGRWPRAVVRGHGRRAARRPPARNRSPDRSPVNPPSRPATAGSGWSVRSSGHEPRHDKAHAMAEAGRWAWVALLDTSLGGDAAQRRAQVMKRTVRRAQAEAQPVGRGVHGERRSRPRG